MNKAVLYLNSKGEPVTHSSYSARSTFKKCPREFQLTRVLGWSGREERAAPLFGKCIEAGVQAFEESGREAGKAVSEFSELWRKVTTIPHFDKLVYTRTEGSWDALMKTGSEMMKLYEATVHSLPISTQPRTQFQQTVRKELFPSSQYAGLENKAIFDMLSFPRWDHPKLPKIEVEAAGPWAGTTGKYGNDQPHRPLIIDMKTSGKMLDESLVMLDPQLAEYAWMSRIPDIAFLWFVKHGHTLKRGDLVSLLQDVDAVRAGAKLYVIAVDDDVEQVVLGDGFVLAAYEQVVKGLRGKKRDEAELRFFGTANVVHCSTDLITKQQIQFAVARLTQEQIDEIGRDVAQTTIEMVKANEQGYYPKLSGIRFPREICNFCSMRWICTNNPEKRDQQLKKSGEEWLDGADSDVE